MRNAKLKLVLFFAGILPCWIHAFNIDSVEFLLKKKNPLIVQVYLTNAAAQYYIRVDPAKTLVNNNTTFYLLSQLNTKPNDSIYLEALYTKGAYLTRIQETDPAIKLLDRVSQTAIESKYPNIAAKALVDKAVNYESLGEYVQASNGYSEALKIYKSLNDDKGVLMQYINMGLMHQYQNSYQQSLRYYRLAIEMAKRINFKEGLITAYSNLGINYQERKVFDSALFYFEQVLAYDVEQADSFNLGASYNNVGVVQLGLKNYAKAEELFLLALQFKKSQDDIQGYANTCNNLAETYLYNKPSVVLLWLDSAVNIAESKGFRRVLAESYRIYKLYYTQVKNYQLALEFSNKYHALNDSLKSDELNIKLTQVQKQYELEHLAKENAEKDAAIVKQSHTEKLYILLFIALALLAGFMAITVYRFKRLNKALHQHQRTILHQNEALHISNIELVKAKEAAEEATLAKSQFLSTMSHEIRTPLNAIIGLANLLMENNPRTDQKDNLEVLKTSSNNLLAILNDVLDFSKLEAGKVDIELVDFNLKSLVVHLYELFSIKAHEKNLQLVLNFDYKVPAKLKGDSLHINQILSNLISNAIKFTQQGGVEITVTLLAKHQNKYQLQFSVSDTGIGIPFDKQEAIFESFTQADSNTTREFGGTGLGLSITTKLLNMMGAKLSVKSEPNIGSEFSFELELLQSDQMVPETLAAFERNEQNDKLWGRRILLADDNQINLFVIKQFLNKWHIVHAVAENGKQAVDMALSDNYDMILMDLHMPIMDGYLAAQKILEKKPHQIIFAMTANQDIEVNSKTAEVGIRGVILKPFQPEQLAKQLEEAMIN